MNKKVTFPTRPTARVEPPPAGDDWVESRAAGNAPEPLKRLTFDVPLGLHKAIKADCALQGKTMVEEIAAMLEARWRPDKVKE